jgi:C4-dicarboxylate-specific signal transduction histidine kinase
MAKKNITNMGGDLVAKNVEGGVRLEIKLVRIRG